MNTISLIRRAERLITDLRALQSSPLARHHPGQPSLHTYLAAQMLIARAEHLLRRARALHAFRARPQHISGPFARPNPLARTIPESAAIVYGD